MEGRILTLPPFSVCFEDGGVESGKAEHPLTLTPPSEGRGD